MSMTIAISNTISNTIIITITMSIETPRTYKTPINPLNKGNKT